jgi:hypothetical protein
VLLVIADVPVREILLEIFKKSFDKTKNKSNQQFPRACQLEKIEKQRPSVKPTIKKLKAIGKWPVFERNTCSIQSVKKKCIHIQATDKGA